jgi:beta-glucosidase/6-phospho-beta-glucosidase/beta-galactosidase
MTPDFSPTLQGAPGAPAPASQFVWATGIENTFVPQTRAGLRSLDEYALTQHYEHWREDFDLVAAAGVRALRWGIPWYRVQPTSKSWDWRWTDQALDYMVNVAGITPILDLMHYGTPLWLDNSFINASYPQRVAEYTAAVAERYGTLVQIYTPLNEPTINAHLAGRLGLWPPYLHGEDGYYKVVVALARGMVLTTRALLSVQPAAKTVQVEAVGHRWSSDVRLAHRVAQENAAQFLAFDLSRGKVDANHILYPTLLEHGVTDHDLEWFQTHAVDYDVLGANFYPWSYSPMAQRRERIRFLRHVTPGAALGEVLRHTYAHARMPLMVTETSAHADHSGRGLWMDDTVAAVRALCHEGMPIVGYTWFPFFSMYRWECRHSTRDLDGYLIHLGLYDLERGADRRLYRKATPLVDRYRQHTAAPAPIVDNPLFRVSHTKLH